MMSSRFNEGIDQALAESIRYFAGQLDRSRELFMGILTDRSPRLVRNTAACSANFREHDSPRQHFGHGADAMPVPELTYFNHAVDGRSFAGWFRTVGAGQIEVLGFGLLQTVAYPAHVAPANAARQTLARFVRARERKGLPVPTVDEIKATVLSDDRSE